MVSVATTVANQQLYTLQTETRQTLQNQLRLLITVLQITHQWITVLQITHQWITVLQITHQLITALPVTRPQNTVPRVTPLQAPSTTPKSAARLQSTG